MPRRRWGGLPSGEVQGAKQINDVDQLSTDAGRYHAMVAADVFARRCFWTGMAWPARAMISRFENMRYRRLGKHGGTDRLEWSEKMYRYTSRLSRQTLRFCLNGHDRRVTPALGEAVAATV